MAPTVADLRWWVARIKNVQLPIAILQRSHAAVGFFLIFQLFLFFSSFTNGFNKLFFSFQFSVFCVHVNGF